MIKILLLILFLFASCSPYKESEFIEKNTIQRQTKRYQETETVLGEADTRLIDKGENRISNIKTACMSVSGSSVFPGEEFSFNEMTGPRTKENGYKYAPVIAHGEKSYGIGGGVCQVSTTVYRAALKANLTVTEQYNHSEPVAYAPDGNDATVVYGAKDFKFKNNTNNTLYIYVWTEKDRVVSKIVQKTVEIGR